MGVIWTNIELIYGTNMGVIWTNNRANEAHFSVTVAEQDPTWALSHPINSYAVFLLLVNHTLHIEVG